jgi:uncharacterized protein (DUF885 family)
MVEITLDRLLARGEANLEKGGTLRDFHDAFVMQGGLPLPLMRKILLGE